VIQKNLLNIFSNYFSQKKKKCAIFFERQLYIDANNYVQPDLLIYCKDNNDKKNKSIPLIVIEVLSDSTWRKDMTVKMRKYAELGIDEYWIIDPDSQKLSIYKLSSGKYEVSEAYNHPFEDGFSMVPELREKEEREIIKEFSPSFFPELMILLADIFDFEALDFV
jgi:Uma2 family endonuclease